MANDRNGFVTLYRSMLDWEWYGDQNTCRLFVHLILTVNWKPKHWQGIVIDRGQRVSSIPILSTETGLSERAVRTSLEHLKSTGEVTGKSTNKYTILTLKNYDLYQTADRQDDRQTPGNRQAERQSNDNNRTMEQENKETREQKSTVRFAPPTLDEVKQYCSERGNKVNAQKFVDYYESNGWMVGRNKMKSWKASVRTWEQNGKESTGATATDAFERLRSGIND